MTGAKDGRTMGMGDDGASPHTPPEGRLSLRLPSSLRGGLKKVGEGWIAMQSIEGE